MMKQLRENYLVQLQDFYKELLVEEKAQRLDLSFDKSTEVFLRELRQLIIECRRKALHIAP